ncbi:hypothetical protein DICA3_A07272 [Diutina catenulata]
MVSLTGLCALLGVPVSIIVTILRTLLFGGWSRKYRNSPVNMAKLAMAKAALAVPVADSKWVIPFSNMTLINKVVGGLFKPVVASMPEYGLRYDQNAIWLVRHSEATAKSPLIIYLHGGGYFLQTAPSQLQSLIATYKLIDPSKKVSVLHLDYDLASEGYTTPHQLNQMHDLYSRLCSEGYDNITLMGDSAGGNLVIGYLQYLRETHSKLPQPRNLVLISPWCKMEIPQSQYTPGNSFYDNDGRDMITFRRFANPLLLKHITGDAKIRSLTLSFGNVPYNKSDWQGIEAFEKGNVFLICGEDEVFRDDVLEWGKHALGVPLYDKRSQFGTTGGKLDRSLHEYHGKLAQGGRVEAYVEPWGVHDACLIFEDKLLLDIKRNPGLKLRDVDAEKYFGLSRLANFLNEVL